MIKKLKQLPRGMQFMLVMILVYATAGLVNAPFTMSALRDSLKVFIGIVPILLVVFFIMFLLNLWVKPELVKKYLGHESGIKGWLYAILGSIIFAGPPYVLYPILGDLKKHGMKTELLAVFLNTRTVQPAFLPVLIYYFGLPFAVVISIYSLIFSILSGMLIGKLAKV
jgi:uncharacterized membrane protein YraQ (UPF0718 family)